MTKIGNVYKDAIMHCFVNKLLNRLLEVYF